MSAWKDTRETAAAAGTATNGTTQAGPLSARESQPRYFHYQSQRNISNHRHHQPQHSHHHHHHHHHHGGHHQLSGQPQLWQRRACNGGAGGLRSDSSRPLENRSGLEREPSSTAHPASRLYRGYLNPDYTVQSLGKDPPTIKFPRFGRGGGAGASRGLAATATVEPISYSLYETHPLPQPQHQQQQQQQPQAQPQQQQAYASGPLRLTGGQINDAFVGSRHALNDATTIGSVGGSDSSSKNGSSSSSSNSSANTSSGSGSEDGSNGSELKPRSLTRAAASQAPAQLGGRHGVNSRGHQQHVLTARYHHHQQQQPPSQDHSASVARTSMVAARSTAAGGGGGGASKTVGEAAKGGDAAARSSVKAALVRRLSSDAEWMRRVHRLAVDVERVRVAYGFGRRAVEVLKGVDLTLPEGKIYGLLGPSGCGKTTLLKCIVGRKRPQAGQVRVFEQVPGTPGAFIPGPGVGYMPQELTLYPEFTIYETLLFFGKLFRMPSHLLQERITFLLKFLDLPDKFRLVKNLSGGQQRRVSLAAALIHKPPLLILDEPTVGVDPLLRQAIWNYLVTLTREEGMTVIVTTHYIEEARQANIVGLMRSGRMLAQSEPNQLLKDFECDSLEDVFLQLCLADKEGRTVFKRSKMAAGVICDKYGNKENGKGFMNETYDLDQVNEDVNSKEKSVPIYEAPLDLKHSSTLAAAALAAPTTEVCGETGGLYHTVSPLPPVTVAAPKGGFGKLPPPLLHELDYHSHNYRRQQEQLARKSKAITGGIEGASTTTGFMTDTRRRDGWSDTWCRALALVLKNITRVKRNIPVLLFTFLVPSFQVVLFCLCIGADPFELPVAVVNSDVHPVLSQPFLESISNVTIVQRPYEDLDEALASVERGETWGVISIGHNYSTALQYRFLLGIEADNDTIEESTVDIYMDMTNQQIGFILQKTIFESFIAFCEDLLMKMGKSAALAQLPVRVRDPVYGNGKPSFTEFMAPGIILSITYIMAVGLTAISIIMETREGTMERCWVAGVRPFEVVVSHVYSQFSVMLVQVALLLIFIFIAFKIPLEGSLALVIFLTLLQGLSGMTYGLVISSICSDEQSAMMLALGTFYPNLLLSGIIWPIQSMPRIVRYIAYGLPQTIPTESLRCIMYRGWGIDRDEVWIGFVVSISWTLFFLVFATAAFKARS